MVFGCSNVQEGHNTSTCPARNNST